MLVMIKSVANKGKKIAGVKPRPPKNVQGKEQYTINQYFSQSQAKGKGREAVLEEGKLQYTDKLEECFENAESHNIECLIGRLSF